MNGREKRNGRAFAAYLEDELSSSERAECEKELLASPLARQKLEHMRSIRDALTAPVPEFERVDLVGAVRAGLRAQAPTRLASRRLVPLGWVGAAALGALAASLALVHRSGEFRAKSAAGSANTADVWAGFHAYRVPKGATPTLLGERLQVGDGLTFSYTNLGPKPFEYLMIFAVDAKREVRWFYPAYEELGQNPTSIVITPGVADVPLPDIVIQEFVPGPITLHAVFSRRPLRVLEVEAAVARQATEAGELALPDTSQQTLRSVVEP